MKKTDVFGIGNVLIDLLTEISDKDIETLKLDKGIMKLVSEEESKKILNHIQGRDIAINCGGSCPNTIVNLAAFGVKAALSGKIGKDENGKLYETNLGKMGIDSYLSKTDESITGNSIILISPDSERTMNTSLCANQLYSVDDVDEEAIANSKYLYFTGYMWDTDSQKAALTKAIKIAEDNDTIIAFDVADPFAVGRNREEFLQLIENHFDIVFANKEEAKILFGEGTVEEHANKLAKITKIAVVKNGKIGSIIQSEDNIHNIAPTIHKAIDTTGAGDMFAAGFLGGLSKGFDLPKAGSLASYLAGEIVTEMGAQLGPERLKEVQKIVSEESWSQFQI